MIAAVATPIDEQGRPTPRARSSSRAHLLDNGCDGLNVLGTTGEATSFSLAERMNLMTEYREAGMPLDRLMVGTGAAAVSDAIALTRHAAALGFAGALILPPFYYKGVPDDGLGGLYRGDRAGDRGSADPDLSLSLPLHVRPALACCADPPAARHIRQAHRGVEGFLGRHAVCARGGKTGTGFAVFPSTEATLMEARAGAFAGCISATANCNADLCARAWRTGDQSALEDAVAIRKLFDGKALVSGIKALLAHIHGDPALARVKPPLAAFAAADRAR